MTEEEISNEPDTSTEDKSSPEALDARVQRGEGFIDAVGRFVPVEKMPDHPSQAVLPSDDCAGEEITEESEEEEEDSLEEEEDSDDSSED